MANPLNVACPANTWTIVATGITTGTVEVVKDVAHHNITFVLTGGQAPTGGEEDGTWVDEWIEIRHSAAIDVYVYARGSAGEVRVYV